MSSAFDSVGDGELTERSAADQKAQQQRADERNSIFRQFSRGIYLCRSVTMLLSLGSHRPATHLCLLPLSTFLAGDLCVLLYLPSSFVAVPSTRVFCSRYLHR